LATAIAAVPQTARANDTTKEIVAHVDQIPVQRIIWKPHSAGSVVQPPFAARGPGCPAITDSVANCFNSIDSGGEMTIQAGMAVGEGFGSTYTVANPALSFPIEVTLVEFFAGTVASGIGSNITMGWRLEVWDGEPGTAGSFIAFSVDSDPDPNSTGLPGDVTIARVSGQTCSDCSILTGGGTPSNGSAAKVQFSVDQTADPSDRMLVNNTSGTGKFTIMVYMTRANSPGGSTCSGLYTPPCGEVLPCSNAYLCTEGSTVTPCSTGTSNPATPTYATRNWAYYVSCSGGCTAGFNRFSSLGSSCHPTRDILQQVTYNVSACAGAATGACCAGSGSCSVATAAACTGTSVYQGDSTTCGAGTCPTGACCNASTGACSATTAAGCTGGQSFTGNGTVCNPNPCSQPSGACCTAGACSFGTAAACGSGTYQGNNTACATTNCPQPTGACCFGTGCLSATNSDCTNAGGQFQGVSSGCVSSACPTGACCVVSTGACSTATPLNCNAQGGAYRGNGVACSTSNCPPPTGACCASNGFCLSNQSQADCTNAGLSWQGGSTVCSPNPCAPPTGVCCRGTVCTTGVTQANCTSPGGTVGALFSSQTSCNASGNSTSPCCYADFNKSGGLSVGDIFDYLNAWFAGSAYTKVAGDGVTGPTVQDIFSFLNVWFAGC
jgi:hypothetical protein